MYDYFIVFYFICNESHIYLFIAEVICHRVVKNLGVRVEEVGRRGGGYFEYVIRCK